MCGRFGVEVAAHVLMGNHFHQLVRTPEANLSRAMQWLGGGYGVWFNRRHGHSGHLFGGRFKAILIGDEGPLMEVSRYVHLNPVRVAGLGLGKEARRDLALYVGRTDGGMRLRELAEAVGGMGYGAVSMAIGRFEKRLERERVLQQVVEAVRRRLDRERGK